MGSDLSDLSFKCFCDPDEVLVLFGGQQTYAPFDAISLDFNQQNGDWTNKRWDEMGTSSKKCDVKPLSSCLVVWDIYMCLPTCIYTYLHVCIYIYLNVSTCISMCFCICIYIYLYIQYVCIIFKGCRPCRRPRNKTPGTRVFFSLAFLF